MKEKLKGMLIKEFEGLSEAQKEGPNWISGYDCRPFSIVLLYSKRTMMNVPEVDIEYCGYRGKITTEFTPSLCICSKTSSV